MNRIDLQSRRERRKHEPGDARHLARARRLANVIEIRNLRTHFFTSAGVVQAVNGISYDVAEGETVAIVGESGCGKSVGAMSILRLIPDPPGKIVEGSITVGGRDLLKLPMEEMRQVRGRDIGMIFQEPMTSLNPVLTIERQLTETLEEHLGTPREENHARAIELLGLVGISEPERRLKQYPHHLSGGMRQRVMIAMALACNPKLIRRADHRARCDDPGPDPRADEEPDARARRRHDHHHAQSRRRGALC